MPSPVSHQPHTSLPPTANCQPFIPNKRTHFTLSSRSVRSYQKTNSIRAEGLPQNGSAYGTALLAVWSALASVSSGVYHVLTNA